MKIKTRYPDVVVTIEMTSKEATNLQWFLCNATENYILGSKEAKELAEALPKPKKKEEEYGGWGKYDSYT